MSGYGNAARVMVAASIVWRVIGYEVRQPIKLGGELHPNTRSCDKCGQCIKYCVTVKSSDGTILVVGRDCADTLEGGIELAELRNAQRAWEAAEYEREHGDRDRAEARSRATRLAEQAASNETVLATEMAYLRAVVAFAGCSEWEHNFVGAILGQLERGTRATGFDDMEEATIATSMRTVRASESTHVGSVKGKIKVAVTLHRVILPHPDAPFPSTRYVFLADNGAVLVWKTATAPDIVGLENEWLRASKMGHRFIISGTVKAHDEYRGVKQTHLVRCKVSV